MLLILYISVTYSQEYFPANTGVKTSRNTTIAFTNATIYVTPANRLKNATLLVKDGKVLNAGKKISIPEEAVIIDSKGRYIYPSFIDVYSDFGIAQPEKDKNKNQKPQYDANREGYYWNDHIRPETNPATDFKFNKKKAKSLINAGFGVVNTHQEDGIMQGNGILVSLNTKISEAYRILDKKTSNHLSFSKSRKSNQAYPTSRMGAMALLRQTYLDADWYAKGNSKNSDFSLEAVNSNKNLPQIFNAGNSLDAIRADKVGDEFGIQYIILGGGDEFERIQDIKRANATFIIPLNFRKAYDVSNTFLADVISLRDMYRWNQEPSNLSVLAKNGINFALTTYKLKSVKDFNKNLQKAIVCGLDKTKALEALTTIPANILKNSKAGNLKAGSYANFLITSGNLFDAETILYENWTLGEKNIINNPSIKDLNGTYKLSTNGKIYNLTVSGKGDKQKGEVTSGDKKLKSDFSFKDSWIQLTINDNNQFLQLAGRINPDTNTLSGSGKDTSGNKVSWRAIKQSVLKDNKKPSEKNNSKAPEILPVRYPNVGLGNASNPFQQTILIKNTTIWTSENDEVLTNTDLLIENGKIAQIGKNINNENAKIIDGIGKFVTAGIIDEHSHIAASAINEAGHNSTAEVTMEDVVNPDDINIYRNLAGGVTSIQILHGSANPIGGRSAIIKLKWGENAENMIYKNSPKFIKFALGENVKQSNWGEQQTIRFPQTRMGVEQVFIDYFQRAEEYNAKKKSGQPHRKDIELEVLAEIVNKERFISCHSYIQSEINMLMKVAGQFNFNINTFTHILEGYKVADKMKTHGAGASTFSDWWAYKYEVNDAIPYNSAIMHRQGITVAINSDDAEMSRRLNQEAAKTVKYGGLTEQEAWRTVTINPAKLLHIDDRTGSIKAGKDADIVVWSDVPLSIYAKAEKTIVEGVIYFDIENDKQKRKAIKTERAKLISMMLKEKSDGKPTQIPSKKQKKLFHCDTE